MCRKNFILLCCFVYFTSVITRSSLSVVLIEVIARLELESSTASVAITGSFISYCIGQFISGYLGDKFHPKSILFIGIVSSIFTNLSLVFVTNIHTITIIWTMNGFAQALTWPPLVKMLAITLNMEEYKKACAYVTIAGPVGTCLLYIIAPLCVCLQGYQSLFLFTSFLAIISAFLWFFKAPYIIEEKASNTPLNVNLPINKLIIEKGLISVLLAIIIHGVLRDGVATWVPNFISENFTLSNITSILSATVLPVLSIIVVIIVKQINNRVKNEIYLSITVFSIALLASLALILFKENFAISLIAISLLSACMHGINLLLVGNLPILFLKYGKVSTLSGILNACTYIGSSISAYGIAKITEIYDWNVTIIVWTCLCFGGIIFCSSTIRQYKKW